MQSVGGEVEPRRERCVARADLEGFSDHLVVDDLIALLHCGRALVKGDARCSQRQDGQNCEGRETAPPSPDATACGVVRGMQERLAGGRQWRVPGGRVLPASGGRVDSGEAPRLVEVRGVSAFEIPCLRVGHELAVQGAVDLVAVEPVPELFPGLQQDVMGDLDAVPP